MEENNTNIIGALSPYL